MEIEPEANYGEIRITEDNLIQSKDDSAGGNEDGQNQACSLELLVLFVLKQKVATLS